MRDFRNYRGRIIQVTEALDVADAVSNQIRKLDAMFSSMGLSSLIATKWHHNDLEESRVSIDDVQVTDDDILIYHFYLYSEFTAEFATEQYCTKILFYHNITPEHFFKKGGGAYQASLKGRGQLKQILPAFDLFWGASQYNVNELIEFGASPEACCVIPIIVDPGKPARGGETQPGSWVFVGRIAPNKRQDEIVRLFADVRKKSPNAAQTLRLVGGYDPNDPFVLELQRAIGKAGLEGLVSLSGKISDQERNLIVGKSEFNISLSEHEGFGVPLIEAPLLGAPTLALDRAAVAETLGGAGCYPTEAAIGAAVIELAGDPAARRHLLAAQIRRAADFSEASVGVRVRDALARVLPEAGQFKTVSIVICTYNRRDHLERCLDYLQYQSNPAFEVIVVNGPSDDGTDALLEQYEGRIKVVSNSLRNLSVSRNLGIDAASGDIVAFIDDDAIPFDDWVHMILAEYSSRPLTFVGLGGPAFYAGTFWFQAEDNGIDKDCQVKVNIASEEIGKNGWKRYNTGTNATFRRDVLVEVDGFDEQYDYFLDESELCYRIQEQGYRIGYSPEVFVRHEFAQSHNRGGKFNYNWETICKNTVYFIATYSGREGEDLKEYVSRRMQDERVAPLDAAVAQGKLSQDERDKHVAAVRKGVERGLADFASWPKTRRIAARPSTFLPFETTSSYDRVADRQSRRHICIVSKEAPPFAGSGGVGTLYYHLASELLLMGHYVSIVVPSGEDRVHQQGRLTVFFTKQIDIDLPPMDNNFAGNLQWSLSAMAALANVVAPQRPIDIVDSALWDAESLAFSMIDSDRRPALVLRLVTPFAVSAEINQWGVPAEVTALFKSAEKRLVNNSQAIIPISNSIADTMVEEYGLKKDARWSQGYCGIAYWPFFDVNEGYDAFPEFDSESKEKIEGKKIVLFVGRLEKRKGIDLLLEAAESILQDESAVLVIAGRDTGGWADKFKEHGAKLGRSSKGRIILLGEVSDGTREKLLAHAYCLIFPSRYESFGLVPLEAFVHGTPVIASSSGAIPEVVIDGSCGLLYGADDAHALAGKVSELLSDPELRQRLSSGAKARVRQLSSRNSAIHSVNLYARLMRDHRSAANGGR